MIPPGCQFKYIHTVDENEKYYGYGSTMSFIIFTRTDNQLYSIIDTKMSSSYLKSVSLSQSKTCLDKVSLSYARTNRIVIFDLLTEEIENIYTFTHEIIYHQYNKNNNLIVLLDNNHLYKISSFIENNLSKNEDSDQIDNEDVNNNILKGIKRISTIGKVTQFQWYPFCSSDENILGYVNSDNEVYLKNLNSHKKYESKLSLYDKYKDNIIVDIQWYTSDENYKYLLIGFENTEICLCDMDPKNITIINKFEKSGKNLNKMIWIKNEPGLFMLFYKNSVKVSLLNVSSPYVKNVTKFSDIVINNCLLISNPTGSENKLLLALSNGNVELYNINTKKKEKIISNGNSESIFDLKFSNFEEGTIATCSYDGSIKIRNIYKENELITLTSSHRGILKEETKPKIYSIKWSPIKENKNLILSGDSKNTIKIWDIEKQKIISELELNLKSNKNEKNNFKETPLGNKNKLPDNNKKNIPQKNNNYPVLGVDWNEENIILATCYTFIFVVEFNGTKLFPNHAIDVHTRCFKIEFSTHPSDKKRQIFACACEDGKIRIYDMLQLKQSSNISPIKILAGHLKPVFGLSYKPYKENEKNNKYLLASGSEDYKVGIWDLSTKENKSNFLLGHTDKVRNVVWFKESDILISGSWDGFAYLWDVNLLICLSVVIGHKGDIYGIDTNIMSPFLLATSSRDASIRILNYVPNIIEHLNIYSNNYKNDNNNFCELFMKLKEISNDDKISKAEIITKYFLGYPCIKEFFDILRIIMKKSQHSTDNNIIFHISDLYSAYKSKILKLEFEFNNNRNLNYNETAKKEIISEAIIKCAAIDDWEKFCELNILIGNWKKALMFAPKVSQNYWEELVVRYNTFLNKSDNSEDVENNSNENKLLYGLLESSITNNANKCLDLLLKEKDFESCFLLYIKNNIDCIKKESKKNKFIFNDVEEKINELINNIKVNENIDKISDLMKIIFSVVAEKISCNKILEGACIFLSVNQINLAIKLLIRLNELEIAYYLMDITDNDLYKDIIFINLLRNSIANYNTNNHLELIKLCKNNKVKIFLYQILINNNIKFDENEYQNLLNNENGSDLEIQIIKNLYESKDFINLNFLEEKINDNYTTLLAEILDENLKFDTLFKINKLLNVCIIMNDLTQKTFYRKIFMIIIFIEILNNNSLCTKLLINKYLKIFNVSQLDKLNENEKNIISLGNYFYKSVHNESLFNLNYNLQMSLNSNISLENIKKNYIDIIKNSGKEGELINRFSCDLDDINILDQKNDNRINFELNKYIQINNN